MTRQPDRHWASGAATAPAPAATGHGTPAQIAEDLRRYREEAGLDAFQINFNGCHSLAQLLTSMECFTQDVRPLVA